MSKIIGVLTSIHITIALPHTHAVLLTVDPFTCIRFNDNVFAAVVSGGGGGVLVVLVLGFVVVLVDGGGVVGRGLKFFPISFAMRNTQRIHFPFGMYVYNRSPWSVELY